MKTAFITAIAVSIIWAIIYFFIPNVKTIPVQVPGEKIVSVDTVIVDAVEITAELRTTIASLKRNNAELLARWQQLPVVEQIKQSVEQNDTTDAIFTAKIDTTAADSSWKLKLVYYSPVPLHKLGYFNFDFDYQPKPIINTISTIYVTEKKHWYDRLTVAAGYAVVYSAKYREITHGPSIGIFYQLW